LLLPVLPLPVLLFLPAAPSLSFRSAAEESAFRPSSGFKSKPSLEQQKVGSRPLISSAISAGAYTAPAKTTEQTRLLFQHTPLRGEIQFHL
jgi:hypothetical protein